MVCIDLDGCENGSTFDQFGISPGGVITTPTGRDGVGLGLRSNQTAGAYGRIIAPGSDTIFGHFGRFITSGAWGATNDAFMGVRILADAGTVSHLAVTWDGLGRPQLRRGTAVSTIIQTGTITPPPGAWHSFEYKATIHDTTGEFILKCDGVEILNFTGDTRNGGTSTRPDVVMFGCGQSTEIVDDIQTNDTTGTADNTWPGEVCVIGVRAAGNGANNGLTGSDGNSVNNYQQVDEYPMSSTDYNGSVTVGALDTYDMTALGRLGTVRAVKMTQLVAKSDAGAKGFKHVMRGGSGGLVKSATVGLSTTYTALSGPVWSTDGDGNAWTPARVDASEFGFEVTA